MAGQRQRRRHRQGDQDRHPQHIAGRQHHRQPCDHHPGHQQQRVGPIQGEDQHRLEGGLGLGWIHAGAEQGPRQRVGGLDAQLEQEQAGVGGHHPDHQPGSDLLDRRAGLQGLIGQHQHPTCGDQQHIAGIRQCLGALPQLPHPPVGGGQLRGGQDAAGGQVHRRADRPGHQFPEPAVDRFADPPGDVEQARLRRWRDQRPGRDRGGRWATGRLAGAVVAGLGGDGCAAAGVASSHHPRTTTGARPGARPGSPASGAGGCPSGQAPTT